MNDLTTSVWDAYDYVIGCDPGFGCNGVVVVGPSGVIRQSAYVSDPTEQSEMRMSRVWTDVMSLVWGTRPFINIERALFCIENNHATAGRSAQTALMQRELIGVLAYKMYKAGADISRVAATSGKKALTGSGKASKEDMVEASLTVPGIVRESSQAKREAVADALGVALAGAHLTIKDLT